MGLSTRVVILAVVTCAAGLLIGGLIGHFATKSNYDDKLNAANQNYESLINVNKPNSTKDAENREFLFKQASTGELESVLFELSKEPHLAGSERNHFLGDWLIKKWQSYGFKTKKDTHEVLLSHPGGPGKRNKVQLLAGDSSVLFESQESEKPLVPEMNTSSVVPPYLAYTKAGIVESNRVYYINYCRLEDFMRFKNISTENITGSIVMCRYGKVFRGNKVSLAQKYGAVGVIIFNDPKDCVDKVKPDYNETFPNSWFMPPSGTERGSAMDFSGDPLTPDFPSKAYSYRKTVEQLRTEKAIPGIPAQPIGYGDAENLLRELSGSEVPEDWRGGINVQYKSGGQLGDNKKLKVINHNTDDRTKISNVFGIIEGAVEPDRYVLIGNHRDAWMFGATDAGSGTTIMMETSRMFYELMKTGWRPRRTIIFCSWDGEEHGIIGSIEWLEDIRVIAAARAVAYLNCDSGVVYNQVLKMGASPLLYNLIYETTKLVQHPSKTGTLYDEWRQLTANISIPDSKPKIADLGSGSDHTGFIHRHGITSADTVYYYDKAQMKIETYYPLYHTVYDSFPNVKKFVDPNFTYHKALAQFFAEMLRSLSDSVMIPFVTSDYAKRLKDVHLELNKLLVDKLRTKNLTHYLDHLKVAIDKFENHAEQFDQKIKAVDPTSWTEVRRRNDQLYQLERSFTYPLGILDRGSIKHVVFAPSVHDAYASSAFSGIGDSLYEISDDDDKAWQRVEVELTKAIYSVESACKALQVDDLI